MPTGHLAIVQRGRAGVYETLKERFEAGTLVEVIWDRRVAERRRAHRPVSRERRQRERRRAPPEAWTVMGFALVAKPEPPGP